MSVDEVIQYSHDFKDFRNATGKFYFTVPIDFDFALSLPRMEEYVYYKKDTYVRTKENLNSHGMALIFDYDLATREIERINVQFDRFCIVPYADQTDMDEIVRMLKPFKSL